MNYELKQNYLVYDDKSDHVFYILHNYDNKIRKLFWIKLSPNTNESNNLDNSYVSVGVVDKNFTIKDKQGKNTEPHATIHSNTYYHITRNKGGSISSAFTGGLEPTELFEPWLEITTNIIKSLEPQPNDHNNGWIMLGTTENASILLTVDIAKRIIYQNNYDNSRFLKWGKLLLRLNIKEIPSKLGSINMVHFG